MGREPRDRAAGVLPAPRAFLGYYLAEGARAYASVVALSEARPRADRLLSHAT